MATPSSMVDLSTTAASNSPAGSESPTAGDDFLRAIQAILRHTNAKGADIASATTTDIGAATGEFVDVTGTTTITGLGTIAAGIVRTVRFTGALTLTHNATSLILPSGANITTAANDVAQFRSLGSGNWQCVGYSRAAGYAKTGANSDITSLTALTNITISTATVASDDKVVIQDTNDSDKLKTVTAQAIANLAVSTPASISVLNTSVAITDTGTDGKITKTVDGVVIGEETGAARTSTIDGGSALIPEFKCRAWVDFDGTGTLAINGSGNVTSVTDTNPGDFTVNFTTAMPDANYSAVITTTKGATNSTVSGGIHSGSLGGNPSTKSVSALRIRINDANGNQDTSDVSVCIFR